MPCMFLGFSKNLRGEGERIHAPINPVYFQITAALWPDSLSFGLVLCVCPLCLKLTSSVVWFTGTNERTVFDYPAAGYNGTHDAKT
jgi:hypothetical protein